MLRPQRAEGQTACSRQTNWRIRTLLALDYASAAAARVLESHYLLLAFLSGLGTIQIAASLGGYRGLWLIPHRIATRWLGIVFLVGGFGLFLLLPLWTNGPWMHGSVQPNSADRHWGKAGWSDLPRANNVNDINGGLSGTQQAIWFPGGVAAAFLLSVLAGAVGTRLTGRGDDATVDDNEDGLDLLKRLDYIRALRRSLSTFRATWPAELDQMLTGTGKVRILLASGRRRRRQGRA